MGRALSWTYLRAELPLALLVGLHLLLMTYAIAFWHYHHTFDSGFENSECIFRLSTSFKTERGRRYLAAAPPQVIHWLHHYFPEQVEVSTRLVPVEGVLLDGAQQKLYTRHVFVADSAFFTLWSLPHLPPQTTHPTIYTNTLHMPYKPHSWLRLQSASALWVDGQYWLGDTFSLPQPTHLRLDALLWNVPESRILRMSWAYVYLRLSAAALARLPYFEQCLNDSLVRHYPELEQLRFELLPLRQLHWQKASEPERELEMEKGVSPSVPLGMLGLELFLCLVTVVYYALWRVWRWRRRRKEWLIRRLAGAATIELVFAFLRSSFWAWLVVVLLAGVLHEWLPFMNWMQLPSYYASWVVHLFYWVCLVAFFLHVLLGFVLLYTDFFDIRRLLQPVLRLRGRRFWLWLVEVQLVLWLLITMLVILFVQQMLFVRHKPLGYDSNRLLVLRLPQYGLRTDELQLLQDKLMELGFFQAAGRVLEVPSDLILPRLIVYLKGSADTQWHTELWGRMMVMSQAIEALGLRLVEGRYFQADDQPTQSVILNQTAYERLAAGQQLAIVTDSLGAPVPAKVVGVVQDFHFESLHHEIEPMVWLKGQGRTGNLLLRLRPEVRVAPEQILKEIDAVIRLHLPEVSWHLDDQQHIVQAQYQTEYTLLRLLLLAWLTVCASFLLATAVAQQQWYDTQQRNVALYQVMGIQHMTFFLSGWGYALRRSLLLTLCLLPLCTFVYKHIIQRYFAYTEISWIVVYSALFAFLAATWLLIYILSAQYWKRVVPSEVLRV